MAAAILVTGWPQVVFAQGQPLALIRDAETEAAIRELGTPLWQAAGLDPAAIRILLVNDRGLNAFVAGGQRLFLNTGLIQRTVHPGQLQGVIAHETGHIAGGHLARIPEAMRNALITSLIAIVLTAAAGAAGGGVGGGVAAGAIGGQSMGQRSFFAFTRSQETAADQAGVTLLDQTRQSARGFMEFMEILQQQEFVAVGRQDPYMRTHPLSVERVDFLRNHVSRSPFSDVAPAPALVATHARIKAKLQGFLDHPLTTLGKYPEADQSVPARYARAIAQYKVPDLKRALPMIEALIAEFPRDPYFHELRGQMLFENQRVAEALPSYRRAVELLPTVGLLRVDLAQVLIELNDPQLLREALLHLSEAERMEPELPRVHRMRAIVLGRENRVGEAAAALAEQALLEGRLPDARDQARRAIRLLPVGSPPALRAETIEAEAVRELNRR
jgi:predicted Zn-dependent protease